LGVKFVKFKTKQIFNQQEHLQYVDILLLAITNWLQYE